MSNRSKIALINMLTNTAWFLIHYLFFRPALTQYQEGFGRAWGLFLALMILGMVALNVVVTIVLTLKEKKKGGQGFDEVTDEMDRHIEKKSVYRFCLTLSFGLLLGIALLALNLSLGVFFQVLAFTVLFSGLVLWGSYVLGYERGL